MILIENSFCLATSLFSSRQRVPAHVKELPKESARRILQKKRNGIRDATNKKCVRMSIYLVMWHT